MELAFKSDHNNLLLDKKLKKLIGIMFRIGKLVNDRVVRIVTRKFNQVCCT